MKTKTYKNGLVLLYEKNTTDRIDSFQINVLTGSALETPRQYGINHLVEHLVFKSSFKRSTREISEELERHGAIVNAWTNYDNVCFYFHCTPNKIDVCAEIYADMLFNKDITPEEFKKEKLVVCQELAMYKDNYEATNEENYFNYFWNMKPVGGTIESVEKITLDQVNKFIEKRYVPANMVVSVCSSLSFRKIQKIVEKHFGCKETPYDYLDLRNEWKERLSFKRGHLGEKFLETKKTSQVQVLHAFYLPKQCTAINNYYTQLLTCGLSSILFREIREEHGLCYSIHSEDVVFYPSIFNETTNVLLIESSMESKNLKKYLQVLPEVMKNLPILLTDNDVEKAINTQDTIGIKSNDIASDMFYKFCNQNKYKSLIEEKKYIKKHAKEEAKRGMEILQHARYDIAILGNMKKV